MAFVAVLVQFAVVVHINLLLEQGPTANCVRHCLLDVDALKEEHWNDLQFHSLAEHID